MCENHLDAGESGHISPQEQSDTSDDDTASTVPSVPAADVQGDKYAILQWQPFRVLATAKRNLEFDGDAMSPLYGSFETVDEDRHTGDDDLGDMSEVRIFTCSFVLIVVIAPRKSSLRTASCHNCVR